MSETHVVVFAHAGAHAHRRGCHRAPLFHRGKHRAPFTFPIPQQGRYALVVGAAVISAGAVALGSAAALPADGDGPSDSVVAVDQYATHAADSEAYGSMAEPPEAEARPQSAKAEPDSPITEQPAEKYWRAPLDDYDLTSLFGARWGMRHEGLDFGAPEGEPVYAVYPGRVKSAGWNYGGFGQLVIIDHGDGVETYYAHNSQIAVAEGQWVKAGQQISSVGNTGNSFGPHLHFELHVDGEPVDPKPYLLERGVDVETLADKVLTDEKPLH